MYVTYENTVLLWKLECLLISSNLSDFGEPPQLDYKNEIYASIVPVLSTWFNWFRK